VLRAHNVEHEIWNRIAKTETNPFKKYYYKSLAQRIECFESATMNQYDLLVPITKRDQEHFIRMGNTRPVWVCPSGLEWELSDNQIVPGWNCSLFFLGSLDWKPNQEGLLWFVSEVFPALQNLHPDLKLYIAGRNAPLWFCHKVNLPGIVFCGEVTDAREFIMSKGILVAPYFSGGGMRVKIVEAMALGKPVITTPLGAEGLDVNHNENIIIANSAIDYLEQIEKLLKFPDFYLKIGRNALAFIKQHLDYLKISKALACFYKTQLK
jgi:glycosyltransferase involved in cell wall biosynthesis